MITLEGPPIPKLRHRLARRGNKTISYDPQSKQKETIRWRLKSALHNPIMDSTIPILVEMEFHTPIAASLSTTKRNLLLWVGNVTSKPDIDNYAKFYLDCANGILWADDAQVVQLRLTKAYSPTPRTVIKYEGIKHMVVDEKTQGILSLFSPEMLEDLVADFWEIGCDMHCAVEGSGGLQSMDKQVRAARAAVLLSRIADKYGPHLAKIAKKYPGYAAEKEPKLSLRGAPCC